MIVRRGSICGVRGKSGGISQTGTTKSLAVRLEIPQLEQTFSSQALVQVLQSILNTGAESGDGWEYTISSHVEVSLEKCFGVESTKVPVIDVNYNRPDR